MSLWASCERSWVTTRHTTSGWLCEGRTGAALELQPCTFSAGVPSQGDPSDASEQGLSGLGCTCSGGGLC